MNFGPKMPNYCELPYLIAFAFKVIYANLVNFILGLTIAAFLYCGAPAVEEEAPQIERFYTVPHQCREL